MTILVSVFGFVGRFAGDLLTSALGWASSLLFGRVPRAHQVLAVPTDEWDILFRLRLQVERDLLAGGRHEPVAPGPVPGPDVVDAAAGSARGTARSDGRRQAGVRADPLAAPVAGSRR
jgi:hypothetical protein